MNSFHANKAQDIKKKKKQLGGFGRLSVYLNVKFKANLGGCEHRCETKPEEKFVHHHEN